MLQWFPGRGQRHTPSSSTVQQSDSRNQTSRQTRQPSGSLPAQSSRVHNARSQGAGAEDGLIFFLFFFFHPEQTVFLPNLMGLIAAYTANSIVYYLVSSFLTVCIWLS